MTAKTADWTLSSKGLHSLGRELGLWTGEESEEHELGRLAEGIWQHCSSKEILWVVFSRVQFSRPLRSGILVSTGVNCEGLFERNV